MNIENQFLEFKVWASKHNILLTEGEFDVDKIPNVIINANSENPIDEFKKIVSHLGIKIIVYTSIILDKETYSHFEKIIDLADDEEIKDRFEQLKSFENKYLGITFYIFNDGISYTLRNFVKETSQYLEVLDFVNDYEGEEDNDSIYKDLPDDKISELRIKLAENENYPKLKHNTQKIDFAIEHFKEEFSNLSVEPYDAAKKIVSKADLYFEIKVKPKLEIELRQKVKEFLNSGMTKVKIAAELGLSKDALNKYV